MMDINIYCLLLSLYLVLGWVDSNHYFISENA